MTKDLPDDRGLEGKWRLKPPCEQAAPLARQLSARTLIGQLLCNRGITTHPEAKSFLQPSLNDLLEPNRLIGIPPAAKRIVKALHDDEKIVLYGDYDVDGITGIAILWQCLRLAGTEVAYYVPHRLDEGYGLNTESIRQLAEKGAKLIVTIDCGITAVEQAAEARKLGVDLIITDHHEYSGQLPPAVSIVHPDLPGQDYPNKNLCGSGVAFKLAWALAQNFSGAQKVSPEFRDYLLSATGFAALGTIADVVPLTGENRVLTHFGMQGLASSPDKGMQALIKAAGLAGAKLQSADIGFRLAPRLNAAGRMGHARLAVELFTNSTEPRAAQIASYLESQNTQRQKVQKEITAQAVAQVSAMGMDKDDWHGIVLSEDNWHGGVVGIVASKVVDKYHRPTAVISLANGQGQGSCRSVRGFDICQALRACSEHLLEFGGHAMAAGLKIEPDKIEAFRSAFNSYALEHLGKDQLVASIDIDAAVGLDELDMSTTEMIERLGPFGQGNPRVLLLASQLHLVGQPQQIGKKGDHLALTVTQKPSEAAALQQGTMMRAVAFGKAKWLKKLIDAPTFDAVFEPVINRFNGNTTVEMIVRDIRIAPEPTG